MVSMNLHCSYLHQTPLEKKNQNLKEMKGNENENENENEQQREYL